MGMTSNAIRYDLARIYALIAALNGSHPVDDEDHGDLRWLWSELAVLSQLLASRRAQAGKRIVSLAHWRDGGLAPSERPSKAA